MYVSTENVGDYNGHMKTGLYLPMKMCLWYLFSIHFFQSFIHFETTNWFILWYWSIN